MSEIRDIRPYLVYENVREKIVFKLVNTERNSELLEDVPHIPFMDLSIVFGCVVGQKEDAVGYILVHNVHLRLWDVTVEKLFQEAGENTPKMMPYEVRNMAEIMCEFEEAEHPEEYDHDRCMEKFSDDAPMYMLSNKKRIEGAACLIYPNLIRDLAETVDSSLYIIPSSIHELLLIPAENADEDTNTETEKELRGMIKDINDTQTAPDEILSYSLYYYDKTEGKLIIKE